MAACPVVKIKPSHPSQGAFVEINEEDFDATKHEIYVSLPPPPVAVVLPPPPAPPHPLDGLTKDWREQDYGKLRGIAVAACDGRAPENRKQAVQMIEAALAARG